MGLSVVTYALCKKYVDQNLSGMGVLKGANCQIQSIEPITGGNRVTFLWKDTEDVSHTDILDVMDGAKGDTGDTGAAGANCQIQSIEAITGGYRVTFLWEDTNNVSQTATLDVMNGVKGDQGIQGERGPAGPQGERGQQGVQGENGYSPTVSMTEVSNGTKLDITDANGVHTATILNGTDGTNGTDGQDGFSPVVEVTQTSTGHNVSITDKTGTHTFDVANGVDGANGQDLVHQGERVTSSGTVSKELSPNVFCLFSNTATGISDLTLTLAAGNYYDEYMCAFTTSSSGCNLSLPATVTFIGNSPTLEASTYYELSIVNNKAVIG